MQRIGIFPVHTLSLPKNDGHALNDGQHYDKAAEVTDHRPEVKLLVVEDYGAAEMRHNCYC